MQLRDLFDEFPLPEEAPESLRALLEESLDVLQDWQRAERLLIDARKAMPDRLEPAVALYKMYAYSNRQGDAMALIDEVLSEAAAQAGFAAEWRSLTPASAPWRDAEGAVRIYLYTLKAKGFVHLRLADPVSARAVTLKLRELDPQDQVGGSVILEVAERVLEEQEEAA